MSFYKGLTVVFFFSAKILLELIDFSLFMKKQTFKSFGRCVEIHERMNKLAIQFKNEIWYFQSDNSCR